MKLGCYALAGLMLLAGCKEKRSRSRPPAPGEVAREVRPKSVCGVRFTDITRQAGVSFAHTFGDQKLSNMVEATGSGAALLDYNGDGLLDIYLVNGAHTEGVNDPKARPATAAENHLYRNRGDGTFEDVTHEAGVGHTGYGVGVVAGDHDGDGHVDLYLLNYGPNVLYRNRGDGTFEDVTRKAGVAGPQKLNRFIKWSTNAVFLDHDSDGDLDLYVSNYMAFDPSYRSYYLPQGMPGATSYLGQASTLYRNEGGGKFSDVTREAGLYRPTGKGMGASAVDYDGDGNPDLFEANDAMANVLFRNNGDGTFADVAGVVHVAYNQAGEQTASMHGSFGDVNGDGRLDLYVADLTYGALFVNTADNVFTDQSINSGVSPAAGKFSGWGAGLYDFDNDGDLDLYVATGGSHHLFGEQDRLFKNVGGGKFQDASLHCGGHFATKRVGRGVAFGDLDNDGDVDVLVVNNDPGGAPALLRNDNRGGHWLTVKVVGTRSNKEGIGARITVKAGARTQVREVQRARSYLSSCDVRVHFGLGQAATVDEIQIRWPRKGAVIQRLRNVKADQILKVVEPSG